MVACMHSFFWKILQHDLDGNEKIPLVRMRRESEARSGEEKVPTSCCYLLNLTAIACQRIHERKC